MWGDDRRKNMSKYSFDTEKNQKSTCFLLCLTENTLLNNLKIIIKRIKWRLFFPEGLEKSKKKYQKIKKGG